MAINYNCDTCGIEMQIDESIQTTYAGIKCTLGQYIELAKDNPNVNISCQECIDKMPDAWPLFEEGVVKMKPIPEANN